MKNIVIAISGLPGSGSSTAARLLSEKLQIDFFSPGQLFKDIATGRFKEQHYSKLFLKICEGKGLVIPDMKFVYDSHGAIEFWSTPLGKSPSFHEAIDKLQIELSQKGNIVIDGKLSLEMIKDARPKIWLKAELTERAKRIAKREGMEEVKAREIVERKQTIERKEWEKIYGVDYWAQENNADIIIDTTSLTPEQVIEKILARIAQYRNT